MTNVNYSFLISGLAGLATLIGAIVIFMRSKNTNKIICAALSFASGIMITISLFDLLPTSFDYIYKIYNFIPAFLLIVLFLVIGVLCSIGIDKVVPKKNNDNMLLYRTGILSMIVLMLHNIPEGIATFVTSMSNLSFGITIALAISFHNIPEGISIAVPIYYSTGSKLKAFLYTFFAGMSELVGALIAYLFLGPYMNDLMFGFLFSVIAGLMIHIAVSELLPTSLFYGNKKIVIRYMLVAFIIMISCHLLLH